MDRHHDERALPQRDEAGLDHLARRWAAGVLAADFLGLPLLLLATPWRWPAAVLVWASAVALLLVVAALHHHHRSAAIARSLAEDAQRLRATATAGRTPGEVTAPPSSPVRRTGLAF